VPIDKPRPWRWRGAGTCATIRLWAQELRHYPDMGDFRPTLKLGVTKYARSSEFSMSATKSLFCTPVAFWLLCIGTPALVCLISVFFNKRHVVRNVRTVQETLQPPPGIEALEGYPDSPELRHLKGAMSELVTRWKNSLYLVAEYTQYNYVALLSAVLSAALGAVATFLVTSFGWDNSNEALRGFFVGCAVSLPFWLSLTQVFKYQETIAKHETIYSLCCNLVGDVRRVLAAPPVQDEKGQPFTLAGYLAILQSKMEGIRLIGVIFDGSRVAVTKIELTK